MKSIFDLLPEHILKESEDLRRRIQHSEHRAKPLLEKFGNIPVLDKNLAGLWVEAYVSSQVIQSLSNDKIWKNEEGNPTISVAQGCMWSALNELPGFSTLLDPLEVIEKFPVVYSHPVSSFSGESEVVPLSRILGEGADLIDLYLKNNEEWQDVFNSSGLTVTEVKGHIGFYGDLMADNSNESIIPADIFALSCVMINLGEVSKSRLEHPDTDGRTRGELVKARRFFQKCFEEGFPIIKENWLDDPKAAAMAVWKSDFIPPDEAVRKFGHLEIYYSFKEQTHKH